MENEFVPYTEALVLKELGFDEPCLANFINGNNIEIWNDEDFDIVKSKTPAPLYQQAFRWFREKYELYGYTFSQSSQTNYWFKYLIQQNWKEQITSESFNTHEEAELECLKKLIEIIKNGK